MKDAKTVKEMDVQVLKEEDFNIKSPCVSYVITSKQGADLTVTVWYDGRVLISNFCRKPMIIHSIFAKSVRKKNIVIEYFGQ